ncbi:Methyl-accepting chemotaxis protein [Desulfatibacillum alkenivorans DSM 16219]|jgi:methyl-accepting chemotaxis protein|uniref:Methyl-accepting chemotaxis protein n=1 Tax=Desulfatibacillum alkenivorans DSM 16219 TaxID=1121393 RepID=A0A1M6J3U0_9BACT|nr:methyl-accepting chemotaxis protein [Desulfatibacillum alkenivorans]SHJ41356.1 Methyl-accepting chemotaxis protein [Desulfatibacillum alkenivorans DSM 16219]
MKRTIQTKLVANILFYLSIAMVIFLFGAYKMSHGVVDVFLSDLAKSCADRMAVSLEHPMKHQDQEGVLRLLGAETVEKRNYAIVVKSGAGGDIFAGVLRGENDETWRPITDESAIVEECVKQSRNIGPKGAELGVVDYYVSLRYKAAKLRYILAVIVSLTLILTSVLLVSLFFAFRRVVVRPLKKISAGMEKIAQGEGDLTARMHIETDDELGDLARNFNIFTENTQSLVAQVKEVSQNLSAFTSQISSTASELSASSAETSSTLSQVSTTAEEIKQTSMVSNQKADGVAQKAEEAARISKDGENASREAMDGMQRIKDEMQYIAESIMKLSEHSQSIGDIIGAVNDLANESNLLSVNASIEAAKAGDFGKGFGVVAQEVKSLSDQSKQATGQVKAILSDIQASTSKAVMAMERGAKAVETGENLSASSGNAIRVLAQRVEESSQSAAQISASSQQQLMGLDQLTAAMESIKHASAQNAEGARQLDQATARLHELGESLRNLSEKFKVD